MFAWKERTTTKDELDKVINLDRSRRGANRRAIGPLVERCCQSGGSAPPLGTLPSDGLIPDNPQHEDGIRIDPPPSDPVASGTMPEAIAAALPPEDPPGE